MLLMNTRVKYIVALGLILAGSVIRLMIHGENVEVMTAVSLFAGMLLGGWLAVAVSLATIAITDMVIGNSPILLFTWSAWAMIAMAGVLLRGKAGKIGKFTLQTTGLGVLAVLGFYLWTNFGVWLLGQGEWYPYTVQGLLNSYYMGLPFLRNQLVANVVILPFIAFMYSVAVQAYHARFTHLEKSGV